MARKAETTIRDEYWRVLDKLGIARDEYGEMMRQAMAAPSDEDMTRGAWMDSLK